MRLQLALDGTLADSLTLLDQVRSWIDIAEIGTPLVQREGAQALRTMRAAHPDLPLLADFKIMDAGEIEASIAFEAGADIVTVMGFAQDATIAGVVAAAAQAGGEVMVDLMAMPDPAARIHQCLMMGCDYFCVHTAHDVRRSQSPVEMLRALRFGMPDAQLAVAGGVNLASIGAIVEVHPAIVVVGSAITTAEAPIAMARALHEKMRGEDG